MNTAKGIDWMAQRTLSGSMSYVGGGLHTGQRVAMRVRPGGINTGICFVRKDAPADQRMVRALWHNVTSTRQCTTISNEHGVAVRSIEHLLAALRGCGIDNALVELDGPEVPAMDGSSNPFVALIERTGTVEQVAPRRVIQIHKPVTVCDGDKFAVLMPDTTSRFTVEIEFASAAIGFQRFSVELLDSAFKRDLAGARTFGFTEQVDQLREMGLALGGSLQNAVVIEGDRVVNEKGLRFEDEFVRHKVLDCVGDLALAGAPIMGHFFAHKPGHRLNYLLVDQLFAQQDAWSYITFGEVNEVPMWRRLAETKFADAMQLARAWLQNVA
ncbi:MAG: UDP-3-O-acyl-N-acetylglucosamine deacetylase [Acidiferrobacterales bacterium]